MLDYINKCLLLGRYRSISIIDDNISCLIIVINNNNGELTVPIIVGSEVAKKLLSACEDDCLIGIKGKIDTDKIGLIIKAEKIFLEHKKRAD